MFSRTNITEANRHLAAMHERINSLENTVRHQNQTLLDNDAIYQERIQILSSNKDEQINTLQQTVINLQEDIQNKDKNLLNLEERVQEKDKEVQLLQQKLNNLTKAKQFLPSLKSLVNILESTEHSASPMVNGQGDMSHDQSDHYYYTSSTFDGDVPAMAKQFASSNRSRHFSISEDDTEVREVLPENQNTYENVVSNEEHKSKEFYL